MIMMYVMHHAFRRELTAFAAAAAATPVDDQPTWRALNRRWGLFAQALHHHHSAEDVALWPLLMARADEDGRRVLQAMEDEHGEIDPILEAVTAGLARLATTPDADTKAALVVRLCAGKESLARHLAHEETEAIALIQQVMTDADWASGSAYLNFAETEIDPSVAFPTEAWDRLRAVKSMVDPDALFLGNHAIPRRYQHGRADPLRSARPVG